MYSATVRSVPSYGCEPRSLRGEEVLDRRCLGGIAKIGWNDRVGYVYPDVFDNAICKCMAIDATTTYVRF